MLIRNGISAPDDDLLALHEQINGWLLDVETTAAAAPTGVVIDNPPFGPTVPSSMTYRKAAVSLPGNPMDIIGAVYIDSGGTLGLDYYRGIDERRTNKEQLVIRVDATTTSVEKSVFIALFDIFGDKTGVRF